MTYTRFEELPVWKEAQGLARGVFELTAEHSKRLPWSLRDQLERAAVSVSNNIAEGFERGTTKELLAFLYVARGSAAEVRSMLCFVGGLGGWEDLERRSMALRTAAESCSRQLRAWADHLQDSPICGQRHLNSESRASFARKTRQPPSPNHEGAP